MKQALLSLFLLFVFIITGFTQTFTGTGGPIFDDNRLSDYPIEVQGLTPESLTPDNGLVMVCINLVHTWDADLDVRLIAPDGTNIMLSSSKGDDGDNYENTCFDMSAPQHILDGFAPFTGAFVPFTTLGNVNNGQSGNGTWILRIYDAFPYADGGELFNWSLTFGPGAAAPFKFDSSNLPIMLLTTENVTIPNEPKIAGKIQIIDHGAESYNHLNDLPSYEGLMGIEVRGASSQGFPKKSYGMEIQDSLGADLEASLLGLPAEEDWILYAPYTDKSLIRDAITYKLGNDEGRYAPGVKFVEMFLNGDYQGVYCLEEKIKRDKNRVNIAKLTAADTIGEEASGGYILKVDRDDGDGTYFLSNYTGTDPNAEMRIVFEDPKGPALQPSQRNYIETFFHAFEDALYGEHFADPKLGYRKYVNDSSLVDYFLINELGHNVDGYRLSTYMYKDRDSKDSLLHMGPLWDFNLAYGNVNYCESQNIEGWAYIHSGACGNTPLWWNRLLEDSTFQNSIQCRYQTLRQTSLNTDHLLDYIDSLGLNFAVAQHRNYDRWPVLGRYVWPNNIVWNTYDEEILYLKDWIAARLEWMDVNLPGECIIDSTEPVDNLVIQIYPSPARDEIRILADRRPLLGDFVISNMTGIACLYGHYGDGKEGISIASLAPGTYVISLKNSIGKIFRQKFIIVR